MEFTQEDIIELKEFISTQREDKRRIKEKEEKQNLYNEKLRLLCSKYWNEYEQYMKDKYTGISIHEYLVLIGILDKRRNIIEERDHKKDPKCYLNDDSQ
jgi:hypothetical protein